MERPSPIKPTKKLRLGMASLVILLAAGCAQVPPSSVSLSSSIGEDVTAMQQAHKAFVNFYYDNMQKQADSLIANYREGLIREITRQDAAVYANPRTRQDSLFNAVQQAFVNNRRLSEEERQQQQENALLGMVFFYDKIDKQVEKKKKQLLIPLQAQREQFLTELDGHYATILRKNSAITELLSSVVKVHGSQQQLAEMAGAKDNLRQELGEKLAKLSSKASQLQAEVDDKATKVEDVEKAIAKFKEILNR